MEHAIDYLNEQPRPKGIVEKINQARLQKMTILPYEIVGLDGTKTTDCGKRDEEKRLLKCNVKMLKVEKKYVSCIRKYRHLVSWLRNK